MSKYISLESKVCKKIKEIYNKNNCSISFVDNLNANACIIKNDNKYIVFVSKGLDKKLLPLSLLHEVGHIYHKTLNENPTKYNKSAETLSNLYAVNRLLFTFPLFKRVKLLFLTLIDESKMYNYYIKETILNGDEIYERIIKN